MKVFWKIFISMFISFVVIVSFVSYVISVKQISDAEKRIVEDKRIIGDFLSKEIEVGYFETKWPFESLKKFSEYKGVLFWWIVRHDGTIHLADNASFMGTYAPDYFPQIASMLGKENISLDREQNHGIFFKPLETGKNKWSFWFGFSLKEVSERRKEIIFLITTVSMSALVALGVILFFAIKHFTKPIEGLNVGAAIIGKGDLTHRIKIESEDELGQLANSFNKMAEDLQKTTVSKDYMDNIIGSMMDPLIVVDPDERIRIVNKATAELLGYKKEELIGNPVAVLFSATVNEAADNGTELEKLPKGDELRNYETFFKAKDGKNIPILFSRSLMRDKDGNIVCMVCAGRDITERKRAEEALRESEERYRSILNNIEDGYYELDLAGNFTFFNDSLCRALGYSKKEMMGLNNRQYMDKETAKKVYEAFNRVYATGEPYRAYDWEIIRKDGTKRIQESSVSLMRNARGERIGFRGVARDVTEKKKAEQEMAALQEQLRQSQKMEAIGQLAGGIAHDFNNLLTVIKGYSQLSLMELQEGDALKGNIEEIQRAAERAANLTRQLLAFSRRQIMEMKVLDLNTLMRDLDKMLHRVLGEDIGLATLLAADLGRLKADAGQMEQVIVNLAVNAKDAMLNGGKLTIETANVELDEAYARAHIAVTPGRYVMLSVSDTGCGMTPEVKERIFEPFFTTKEKGKGTGLGLSTVYGIVKQSGGNVWVYSELGMGTTFKIYFPRLDEPLEKLREKVRIEEIRRGSETILIVEDEEEVRKVAVRMLEKQGYTVLEARHEEEALLFCEQRKEPIHLILTDVVMPQMSGRQLIDRSRQVRQDFKVLYMSGYADNTIVHHGVLEKGVNYIQKPFTVNGLAGKVREVLDK
jgi:PAS domain S-box-containing protein